MPSAGRCRLQRVSSTETTYRRQPETSAQFMIALAGSVSTIVTGGYGSFGSSSLVVTGGYSDRVQAAVTSTYTRAPATAPDQLKRTPDSC